jgi:chromosome segregation protein
MTAPARLLSVRLQGFKSFAERTHVAFGPGISAVVGPNGSGKSNLADALRWALGEQGRALRTRKAEDVIWAGSERRPALGMADVQLVLDNADGLLPVDFGVVELGRRLFRSGDNEYVLNRNRVRLRDLVDLLDAAHLAENAFLFIGQGMVDQALALRPEERRPLFEEVAGVRRHERRRRRAEEQLTESESNLARVEDILGELRPQVRRLAAQAQQQTSRRDAGEELAEALLIGAHVRWHTAAARVTAAEATLAAARAALDAGLAELAERETAAGSLSDRLAASAAALADARRAVDVARERLTAARLRAGSIDAASAAIDRDRVRLTTERTTVEAALAADRRRAAVPLPEPDHQLEADLRAAEASLDAATRELHDVRSAVDAVSAEREARRRGDATRAADLDVARRRLAELERELTAEAARQAAASTARDAADAAHASATADLESARSREGDATRAEGVALDAVDAAAAAHRAAVDHAAELGGRVATLRGGLAAAREAIDAVERDGLGAAAKRAGGRRIDDGLVIEPELRAAVATALGAVAGAFVVDRTAIDNLAEHRGIVAVREALAAEARSGPSDGPFIEAVRAAGGGLLADALRADPTGAARRVLAHAAWLPSLDACLGLQGRLPTGWILVPRDGSAAIADPAVRLGRDESVIDRRAAADELAGTLAAVESSFATAEVERAASESGLEAARAALVEARSRTAQAGQERRAAELADATTGRAAEASAREAAWLDAQVSRLRASVDRAAAAVATLDVAVVPSATGSSAGNERPDGLATLEGRVADLRAARDRLDGAWRVADAGRREAERTRAGIEAAATIGQRRLDELDAAVTRLAGDAEAVIRERAAGQAELATAGDVATRASAALDTLQQRDAADRLELGGIEATLRAARAGVRIREEAARLAEREELEARMGLDALREQVLVELAGLGELGLRHLPAVDAIVTGAPDAGEDEGVARLEAALELAARRWTAEAPPAEAPSPGRLAGLRRRFHELGAANPYALEEHAAMAARLETLETQRNDLLGAVSATRNLIAELDGLIARQFRATFDALESAFDARFKQLFGGGFARLSLTEPGDLATTGIEITARPPGKKPQALAMLSGGERALTAVALLFAMLEIRPVPFCVLDEVDAALDEANIGRFTEALRDLAGTTQFIVITHNRGTIETADALYGVTVGDDSVSRVISLRLEEATAIAAAAEPTRRREPIIPAGLAEASGEETADAPLGADLAIDATAEAAG